MSNQTFKTKLSDSKFILFDYGTVLSLPVVDVRISAICNYNGILWIKQKGKDNWERVSNDSSTKFILQDVEYGVDNELDTSYSWESNILTVTHNLDLLFCNVIVYSRLSSETEYSKTIVPYDYIDSNTLSLDFFGLENCVFIIIIN